jgi:hypothetical protein
MALVILALLLFLGMVAAWVILPGSVTVTRIEESVEPMSANVAGQTA